MAEAPSSKIPEVERPPSAQVQREAQSLPVLRAIVKVIVQAVQQQDYDDRTLIKQLSYATTHDEIVELIPPALLHLHLHDTEAFVIATKALADGSRNESWRYLLGLTVLESYLDLVAEVGNHAWTIDALRLIGNCCIDSGLSLSQKLVRNLLMIVLDLSRNRILRKIDMASLLKRVESTEQLAGVVIGVLYNLCLDYGNYLQLIHSTYLIYGRACKESRQNAWTVPTNPSHLSSSALYYHQSYQSTL